MLDAADLLELLCMQEMAVCQVFKVSTGACGRLHLAVAAARLLAAQCGAELGRVQQLLVHAVAEGTVLPCCMQQLGLLIVCVMGANRLLALGPCNRINDCMAETCEAAHRIGRCHGGTWGRPLWCTQSDAGRVALRSH
jgi:hypothetical protein